MTRILSVCFDDGFRATALKVARAFEDRACRACFCVLAAPELVCDPFIVPSALGDWSLWRELRAAGHEIAPHGYAHERFEHLDAPTACASVRRTWEVFARELPRFDPSESLFHLAYLTAPEPVVEWIGARSLGVRGAFGANGRNDLPVGGDRRRVDCITFGGEDAERRLASRLERFIQSEAGWLVLVLHGLDGEGWGSITFASLERLLDRALDADLRILPPNEVLLAHEGNRQGR